MARRTGKPEPESECTPEVRGFRLQQAFVDGVAVAGVVLGIGALVLFLLTCGRLMQLSNELEPGLTSWDGLVLVGALLGGPLFAALAWLPTILYSLLTSYLLLAIGISPGKVWITHILGLGGGSLLLLLCAGV